MKRGWMSLEQEVNLLNGPIVLLQLLRLLLPVEPFDLVFRNTGMEEHGKISVLQTFNDVILDVDICLEDWNLAYFD